MAVESETDRQSSAIVQTNTNNNGNSNNDDSSNNKTATSQMSQSHSENATTLETTIENSVTVKEESTTTATTTTVDRMAPDRELIDKLLRMVKREVKQIMEEAVTRKFVHEESSSITALCAAVDACLANGLKRRALGLFKTNSTTALLQKVAKNCEEANSVLKRVTEIEANDPNRRSSSGNESGSLSRTRLSFRLKPNGVTQTAGQVNGATPGSSSSGQTCVGGHHLFKPTRYLWIRVALFEKRLVAILDHVVVHADKYYERDALVADPVAGQILASLLVGPCALDYTRMKTQDWSDPPADELVQRHRITSTMSGGSLNSGTPPSSRKPLGVAHYRRPLQYYSADSGCQNQESIQKEQQQQQQQQCQQQPQQQQQQQSCFWNQVPENGSPMARTSNICWSPRDYVESLHQNSKSQLLFGKNNVVMQPQGDSEPLPGYLSLHHEPSGLIIKWTPNQLINGRLGQTSIETGDSLSSHSFDKTNIFLKFALNIGVENIVYLHCHQAHSESGSIVMVGRDGVMHPPIKFPPGGHLLSFLTCLEAGLVPWGQLDPPLWSEKGKGKVFPKLRRKDNKDAKTEADTETDESTTSTFGDYVFRIVWMSDKPETISPTLFDGVEPAEEAVEGEISRKDGPDSISIDSSSRAEDEAMLALEQANIQMLCDTMRKQIISRAFYGWLAYCRHLKTVRTHLADLVNPQIIGSNEQVAEGVTEEFWASIQSSEDGRLTIDQKELMKRVYYGGVDHKIRPQVWPYLLGHYHFEDTSEEREKYDEEMKKKYEMIMSDWLAVEAIVLQRDKEIVAANLAKLSSESTTASTSEVPFSFTKRMLKNLEETSASNEVFDEDLTATESRKSSEASEATAFQGSAATTPTCPTPTPGSTNGTKPKLFRHKQVESVASIGATGSHILVTNPSVDNANNHQQNAPPEAIDNDRLPVNECGSQCVSPASSNGGIYSNELLDLFSLNIHRIHKDVQRCDRNFWYFTKDNLEKLRNVMCTYVWEHLDIGYVQGMCDLVAPLLVIFDDEVLAFNCFSKLMHRMVANFPHGGAMDTHFANMRSLIQILDGDVFEVMHQNGDYTHFYFCYRWFLLDFKREFVYADIFSVWETIWSAKDVASSSFVLFIALALVEYYRDIILENNMDFTDIIKFFNEMAERHEAKSVLQIARDLVLQIQTLIDK